MSKDNYRTQDEDSEWIMLPCCKIAWFFSARTEEPRVRGRIGGFSTDPGSDQAFTIPWCLSGKRLACSAADLGSVPGWGRYWRRKWRPTAVSSPGKVCGRRSLGAAVHGLTELDTTERLTFSGLDILGGQGTEKSKGWSRSHMELERGRGDCSRRELFDWEKMKVSAGRWLSLKNSSAQSEGTRSWRLGECFRK